MTVEDGTELIESFGKIMAQSQDNISDELFVWLRQMILSGSFPPGYTFPNETVFCNKLGVGRTSLREAYKALESIGFITRTKRGTYVNSEQAATDAMPFSMMIEKSGFEELLEFRMIFEGEIAALAAKRATPGNIANLKKYLHKMEENHGDLSLLTRYDTDFHMEVANAAHNKLLISTMSSSADTFFKFVYRAFQIDTESNIRQALAYHHRILDAIMQRDSAHAKQAMTEHVASVLNRVT